jgi:hypothetical protein
VPSNLNQNSLVPVTNTINMTRASTPPILRRGAKSRRRKDSEGQDSCLLPDCSEDIKVRELLEEKKSVVYGGGFFRRIWTTSLPCWVSGSNLSVMEIRQ